jgi:type II secretory pathway predicted ATPase ExeA
MRAEVMEYYGLTKPLNRAGYYETEHHGQMLKSVRATILEGRIVALCGVIGSGKTVTLRRLQQQLKDENKITVSRSLTVEKQSIKLGTLIAALFYDLSPGKKIRVPPRIEDRERELQELVKKSKRPVALFIDDAHALKDEALTGIKRLMEVIEGDGGRLSVVLAGWPKLRNDLRRPKLEEIGLRTDTFSLDGITGSQREYIHWLLSTCAEHPQGPDGIISPEAVDLLASRLRTPLQIEWHLTQAFESAYQSGESPVGAELVEAVLSRHLEDMESTLTRQGYGLKDLVQNFDAKPAEIKALFANQLDPTRASELRDRMRLAGLPI